MTATPARIRLVSRDVEYAVASNAAVLAGRPDARDGGDQPMWSAFNSTTDAQALLNERFAFQQTQRQHEGAEADAMFRIGVEIPLSPSLPKARVIDDTRALDVTMVIRGISIDFNTDRNSIEADG